MVLGMHTNHAGKPIDVPLPVPEGSFPNTSVHHRVSSCAIYGAGLLASMREPAWMIGLPHAINGAATTLSSLFANVLL